LYTFGIFELLLFKAAGIEDEFIFERHTMFMGNPGRLRSSSAARVVVAAHVS
jgi:hypothetical protein